MFHHVPLIYFELEAHKCHRKRKETSKYSNCGTRNIGMARRQDRDDSLHYNDVRRSFLQTTMPTGNTSPILPPSSIIVVWLCGKIRQLSTCTNMSLFSVCACRMYM